MKTLNLTNEEVALIQGLLILKRAQLTAELPKIETQEYRVAILEEIVKIEDCLTSIDK